jgi:hypothetical protein
MSNASIAIDTVGWTASTPSDLNFAFTGTLTLSCTSNCGSAPVGTFNYPIVVGQGHTGSGQTIEANNWWIGGQGWINFSCPAYPRAGPCMLTPDSKWGLIAQNDNPSQFTLTPNS